MSQKLTISIIIPVYNEEDYLGACLDAITTQTEAPDEVIVVDNCSTDASVEIAKSYGFVTVIKEKKQGVGYARDAGFDAAKSDIIGRIDADTRLSENWVESVKKLLGDSKVAAVNGPVFYYDMPFGGKNYWVDHQFRVRLYRGAPHAPFLFGSNSALRKSAWEVVRGSVCIDRQVHEDLDLAIHLSQSGHKILYDKSMVAGTSARRYDDSLNQWRKYMRMYLYSYHKHGIYSFSVRVATGTYWFGYFLLRWIRPGKGRARKNPMAG